MSHSSINWVSVKSMVFSFLQEKTEHNKIKAQTILSIFNGELLNRTKDINTI